MRALGGSKDYKSRDKRIKNNLERHSARMNELIALGMGREDASKQAYKEMKKEGKK